MKPSKPHRLTAAFFDLFIIGAAVQMVGAWTISLTSTALAPTIAMLLNVFLMLWALHKIVSGRFIWAIVPYGYSALGALQAVRLPPGESESAHLVLRFSSSVFDNSHDRVSRWARRRAGFRRPRPERIPWLSVTDR
jgi:hypothetical protein